MTEQADYLGHAGVKRDDRADGLFILDMSE